MSVADLLGVEDVSVGLLARASVTWPSWRCHHRALAPVEELGGLRDWLRAAHAAEADLVLGALVAMADEANAGPDGEAATACVAWALLPGAVRLAHELLAMGPMVDQLVAARLWIEIRSGGHLKHKFAANVLRNTRAAVIRDYDWHTQLTRSNRTRTQTRTSPVDPYELAGLAEDQVNGSAALLAPWHCRPMPVPGPGVDQEPTGEVYELLEWACAKDVITDPERALLLSLLCAVQEAQGSRGKDKAGLLGVKVTAHVAKQWGIGASTVRRRAGRAIEVLAVAAASGVFAA